MTDPDKPSDALGPIVDALAAAAKTAGVQPAGDPKVSAAIQLGWLMEDLLNGRAPIAFPDDLDLAPATGFEAQARQLTATLNTLKLTGLDPGLLVDQLSGGSAAITQATDWQPKLAAALLGADTRFAKGFGLGRQLNAVGHETWSQTPFREPRRTQMVAALDDLSTVLPPHAGRGVANSIGRWTALKTEPADIDNLLASQCELWRPVLTGEKKPTELLEPENYLDAADQLAAKLRATATMSLKQLSPLVVLIVALFAAGVVLLALRPAHAGTTAAGLSGVLAAVGLTWKGVGGTIGKLAGKLEAPLWGAEVDGAVTDAITLVGKPPATDSIWKRRRAPTVDYAERASRANHAVTRARS
jgi:hypothetical protein